jgi:hypothetical protein
MSLYLTMQNKEIRNKTQWTGRHENDLLNRAATAGRERQIIKKKECNLENGKRVQAVCSIEQIRGRDERAYKSMYGSIGK